MTELQEMFSKRNVDPDTRIIDAEYKVLGEIPVVKERWVWEGVIGKSVVFRSEDVKAINDSALRDLVATEIGPIDGDFTISRKDLFTFFNSNFEVQF